MTLKLIKSEKLKIILFLLLFFMTAGLVGLYYFESLISGKRAIQDVKIDSEASLILNTMQHTSTRNGIREWTLEASSARVLKNQAEVLLKDISVLFFLKDGSKVGVTAQQGSINTKESDIHFSDNVIVKHEKTVLKTDQLHYEKKSHIIFSEDHVTVTNNSSTLDADTLKVDLNNNTLLLKGHLYGIFSDSFDFSNR